jgi:hypothetical protein
VNSIFIPDFPLTLPLSPDSGGEGGVRGDSHGAFYATFRLIFGKNAETCKYFCSLKCQIGNPKIRTAFFSE